MRSIITTLLSIFVLGVYANSPASASETVVLNQLFQLKGLKGTVEIKRKTDAAFEPAIEDRAYPYGTTVKTGPGSIARILLSKFQDFITVEPDSVVIPDKDVRNSTSRTIRFVEGEIGYSLSRAMAEAPGKLSITAPLTIIDQLKGEGRLRLSRRDSLRKLRLAPRTESVRVSGWQFSISKLGAESVLEITSSSDRGFTSLKNLAGDFTIVIDKGQEDETPSQVDMSPLASISIWREFAPVGGRLLVSVLVSDPEGRCIDQFTFPADITLDDVAREANTVRIEN